ncbi:hypothetical protein [Muricoccus nepalensis]|uniref:hypothetical protein n=1 Tax=Muricoccus nepalensis TaxID=1854500 RepID=UPI0011283608|nr:hypothetical protein [Roseomonas nepalensis]
MITKSLRDRRTSYSNLIVMITNYGEPESGVLASVGLRRPDTFRLSEAELRLKGYTQSAAPNVGSELSASFPVDPDLLLNLAEAETFFGRSRLFLAFCIKQDRLPAQLGKDRIVRIRASDLAKMLSATEVGQHNGYRVISEDREQAWRETVRLRKQARRAWTHVAQADLDEWRGLQQLNTSGEIGAKRAAGSAIAEAEYQKVLDDARAATKGWKRSEARLAVIDEEFEGACTSVWQRLFRQICSRASRWVYSFGSSRSAA